jgi:hypothetical protein
MKIFEDLKKTFQTDKENNSDENNILHSKPGIILK